MSDPNIPYPNLDLNAPYSPPPSPPLKETLPLLSLSTSNNNSLDNEEQNFNPRDSNNGDVSLHLSLPSSKHEEVHNDDEHEVEVQDGEEDVNIAQQNTLNNGGFWIPTPAEVFNGPVPLCCPLCSKLFNKYNNMETHMRYHGPQYTMLIQSLRGTAPTEMRKLPCYCFVQGCKKNINTLGATLLADFKNLRAHFKIVHGIKQFVCRNCAKAYARKCDLKTHEKNCGKRVHSVNNI